jgi:hypothetical protein
MRCCYRYQEPFTELPSGGSATHLGRRMKLHVQLSRRWIFKIMTCVLAVASLSSLPRMAQAQVSTSTLAGLVADSDKAVIPGAQVTIVNRNNRFTRTAKTNGTGAFTFSSIGWGDYDLTVTMPGFRKYSLRNVHLDPGDTRTLPLIQMAIGEVSSTVTVQAGGQNQIDDTGERSSIITADEIQKLTLQGRDVTELIKTLPGAGINNGNGSLGQGSAVSNTIADSSNTQLGGSTGGYSLSGSPINGVSIRSDGANLTDPGTYSGTLQNINNEATAEVKVEQQNFGADTANGPLVINAVSKAGGVDYHGSLYVNGRTSQLNSTDAFLKRLGYNKPTDRYVYPGITFGGPLKIPGTDFNHAKHFTFFVQGEDLAQRNTYAYGNVSSAIQTALVPTAAMRAGDFSPAQIAKYLPPGSPICYAHPGVPCATPSDAAQAALFTQYQNVHTVPISSYKGDAITCNGVPGDCEAPYLDPGATAQFKLFPLPNTPNGQTTADGYNFSQLNLVPNNLWTAHTKLEFKPNERQTFSLTYTAEFGNTQVPQDNGYYAAGNSGSVNEPGGSKRNQHTHSGAFNWTSNFSATLTNEAFGNFAYSDFYDTPIQPSLLNDASIGYPYGSAYANGTKQFPTLIDYGYDGLPLGVFPDYSFGPFYSKTLAPGFGDNLTKAIGRHTIKIGVNVDRPTINNIQTNTGGYPTNGGISNYYVSPSFNLPNDPTKYTSSCYGSAANDTFCANSQGVSNALANYLIGDFQGYQQSNENPHLNMRQWSTSFFATDDFKVTKNLTITYGVRFDHLGRWTDQHGIGFPVWRPDLYNNDPIGGTIPLPGLRWHGIDASTPNAGYPTRALFYSPRFGMSYDVFGDGKTTFSGGYGLYRFHEAQNDLQPVLAISNGLRTVQVSNPNFIAAGSKGLRMSYVQSLNISPNPNNSTATFESDVTGFPSTTTSIYALKQGDTESPLTETYSATVTQQLRGDMTFSVGYAGNQSHDLLNDGSNQGIVTDNVNAIPVAGLFQADPNPASRYYGITYTASNIPGLPAEQLNDFRPYKHYSQIQVVSHTLYSNYNGLQLTLNRSKGFASYGINYTFSKVLGVHGSFDSGIPGDSFNLRNDYGPLSYDHTHIFNSYYDFQIGSHYHGSNFLLRGAANGWEVSGTTFLQSGPNLQATDYVTNFGLEGNVVATQSQQAYGVNNETYLGTPDVQLQPLVTCNPGTGLRPHQYIRASCFQIPQQGGANGPFEYPYIHGPAYVDSDLTAIKNFPAGAQRSLQLRFAAFNFLNHPLPTFTNKAPTQSQLQFPLTSNSNFGQTTFTAGRRTAEVEVKYSF